MSSNATWACPGYERVPSTFEQGRRTIRHQRSRLRVSRASSLGMWVVGTSALLAVPGMGVMNLR